jgi:N-acetylglutamate synthase-like GNAT family acetyltransferase
MPCEGPVHLRRATTDDAAGIARVHVDGWQRALRGVLPDEYIERERSRGREGFWRDELTIEAPDRKPWVALLDEQIIGFASGGLMRTEDADPGTGEIYTLFVAPECWERGIRTNLIEHVVRDLREHGFERAVFWVLAADTTMRAFAEFAGFVTDGTQRFEDSGGTQVEELRYTLELG